MRTFDEAIRYSTIMTLIVVALRFDGAGSLVHWAWWECVLLSLLPLGVFFAACLVLFVIAFCINLSLYKRMRK
jgi:hypothetical protein